MPILRPLALLTAVFCGIVLLSGIAGPATSRAEAQTVGIAAVVNDQVISLADVDARLNLVLITSSIPNSAEVRNRVRAQVIRILIDEKLETVEAKAQNISLPQSDIDNQYAALAQQNHMTAAALDGFLQQHSIAKQTLIDQITAQMQWSRLVHDRYSPTLMISDTDVNDAIREIESHRDEPQSRVAEIFLPVDSPQQDADVAESAQRLVDQIKQGASFSKVAQQFSQAPSAATGGDLGWLSPGMLPPEQEKIIAQMQPQTLGGPFRLTGGYYIFGLIDRRAGGQGNAARYSLTQVVFPVPQGADPAIVAGITAKAKQATQNLRSCEEINALGKQVSPDLSGPLGDVAVGDLPSALQPLIAAAKVAVPLDPLPVRGGIGVYMVCGKQGGAGSVDRNAVMQQLEGQRFQNIAQRYLSDLRRVAYIDLRS